MGISSQNHQGIDQLTKLTRLFSPVKIGMVELKNRLMMAPMGTHFNVDGFLTETTKNYIIRRAVGGVALITTEYTTVAPHSQVCPFYQGIWGDKFIPGVKELATAIHHAGAKLSVQLAHGGRECKAEVIGRQPVAPSPLLSAATGEMPRELKLGMLELIW